MRPVAIPVCLAALAALAACATAQRDGGDADRALRDRIRASTAAIDDARLRNADADVGNWLSYGRTYDERRMSPLTRIDDANVAGLGLAWSLDLGTERGIEATPIVVDGVLFATGPWSVVYAIDARSGRMIWSFDPAVPRERGRLACCDVVNRGVAVYKGRIYFGTLDGRLIALDAATGVPAWETITVDQSQPYTITGAPRVVEGKVLIGNGGAEMGVRGYISAYDAASGALVWRTYTVPGDPSKPYESEALERAAATWTGDVYWKVGGGGTAWDAMAYDPELGLLYVGTGNGSPWSHLIRSPGGGDNLFVSSILALRPSDGEIVWYFQTTPGDDWDYTSTQHLILADLEIDGAPRKVIMQAPKNGFFYVLDRETGAFLSAKPYVPMNWATGVDAKGRPIKNPAADYRKEPKLVSPSTLGGHNWHPMSFNPQTGLVYLPAQEVEALHELDTNFRHRPGGWNTGTLFEGVRNFPEGWSDTVRGYLTAWDPVAQREVWRAPYLAAWNGGTLTTAGNLVFQGTSDGRVVAYRASDGAMLWESPAGTGVVAAPVTYLVDGEQYVTVMAGWGGVYALAFGEAAAKLRVASVGRVLTFKLSGTASLPETTPRDIVPPPPPIAIEASAEEVDLGGRLFQERCAVCHGFKAVGGGVVPDLRFASAETHAQWNDIVLGGIRTQKGMVSFADVIDTDDARRLQAYVLQRALEAQPDASAAP